MCSGVGTAVMFPALLPLNRRGTAFDVFFSVADEDFHISIRLPENKEVKNAFVSVDWKLYYHCQPVETLIQQRLCKCPDVSTFLQELQKLLEKESKSWNQSTEVQHVPQYYSQLLKEIEHLGWENVVFMNEIMNEVHIKKMDDAQREHILQIKFSTKYPEESPKCFVQLPCEFDMQWCPSNTLSDVYEWFTVKVAQYQELWSQLDELDTKTWVLEPEKPSRKDVERRIALGTSVSIQLSVDPLYPTSVPDCMFLGSDQAAAPLREKFNANVSIWNMEASILQNLENVLEMQLPLRLETKREDFTMECGICYSYRFDNCIPNKTCDDSRCQQPYHDSCLYKWLRSLTTSRQSLNVLFGKCPYCNKPITCKMPNSS